MKLGFSGILCLLLVDTFTSLTSASLVQEILDSVKSIESLMQENCRPVCCSSSRSRARKEFTGRPPPPYAFNGPSMMKSMAPQQGPSVNDRVQYIDQNIANLQKMKARLEAEQPKRNKENQSPLTKSAAGGFPMLPKSSGSMEKPKILVSTKNTNVNSNVNTNLSAVKKPAPEKAPAAAPPRPPLPTINPGILKPPATPNPKPQGEKKAEKNVNANVNTNVNTVNRIMSYDLYDI